MPRLVEIEGTPHKSREARTRVCTTEPRFLPSVFPFSRFPALLFIQSVCFVDIAFRQRAQQERKKGLQTILLSALYVAVAHLATSGSTTENIHSPFPARGVDNLYGSVPCT